jgi:hypothetical protein
MWQLKTRDDVQQQTFVLPVLNITVPLPDCYGLLQTGQRTFSVHEVPGIYRVAEEVPNCQERIRPITYP